MNEKTITYLFNIGYFLLGVMVGIFGVCFGYAGGEPQQLAVIERGVEEGQRESEQLIGELQSEIRALKSNSEQTKSIVDSMGIELERSGDTIADSIQLIKEIKSQVVALQDMYSGGDSGDGNHSLEVK